MAVAAPSVTPKPVFKMPRISPCQLVLFQTDLGEKAPQVGVVSKVGNRSVDIYLLGSNMTKSGIRHISDPDLKDHQDLLKDTGGCWKESEDLSKLNRMEATVLDLTHQVADLANRIAEVRRDRKPPS